MTSERRKKEKGSPPFLGEEGRKTRPLVLRMRRRGGERRRRVEPLLSSEKKKGRSSRLPLRRRGD